jgi:hypothetical protein
MGTGTPNEIKATCGRSDHADTVDARGRPSVSAKVADAGVS